MAKKETLWPITRPTKAKHTILRKYLDAWLPILGAGRSAHRHLILIDGFAGPGRYAGGEPGSPLIMLNAYASHAAPLDAAGHFYFIEDDHDRLEHLRGEIANLELTGGSEIEFIEGSFVEEFPILIQRLEKRFGQLPPTFAFIDPFGAKELPTAFSTPLLEIPRCEVLIYVPIGHIARFSEQPEFLPILDALYSGEPWKEVWTIPEFEAKKRFLHDLFLIELGKRAKWVRSFEITPTHEAGGNTYYLFFGTGSDLGLRRMKDAMWKVDPSSGQSFRDTTVGDHPVLFEQEPDLGALDALLRDQFGTWFTIDEAERFTLATAFRDNGHLKPTLRAAEGAGSLVVERPSGKRAGTFTPGTRMRFV